MHAISELRESALEFSSLFFNEFYTKEKAITLINGLLDAVEKRSPFSFVRLGDVETRFLAYKKVEKLRSLEGEGENIEKNLGINPEKLSLEDLRTFQAELFLACIESNILATHRHTVNKDWSLNAEMVFQAYRIDERYLYNEVDVCFNAELIDQGFLLPLLACGRTLLIGNSANEFAQLLQSSDYRQSFQKIGMPESPPNIVGAIYIPHSGTAAIEVMENIWNEICNYEFDIAFVSASFVGKLLAGRIKSHLGAVALDIGWNMQYLTGVDSPVAPARDAAYISKRRGYKNLFLGRIT